MRVKGQKVVIREPKVIWYETVKKSVETGMEGPKVTVKCTKVSLRSTTSSKVDEREN